jgi:serine/threonine protein kinase
MATDPASKGGRRGLHIGKYEVLAHIATGGMGAVYRARDVALGREVALKILPPEMAVKPNMLERFRREARSAARLRHENIVTLYEFGEANGTYFLALEFVAGIDLHEYVSRKGRLRPEMAKQILVQAVRALDHAHRQGIVHRDIKPSNFLVIEGDEEPLVKLTDFGLAQARDDEEFRAAEFRLTRAGTTVGTVDYMAPEQARDSSAADIRSDIYALGCTFYYMLAGNCPFPEGSLTERIFKHIEAEPPDVRRLNPDVPAGLTAILSRMLEKKPDDRYQTPYELLLAIESPERLEGYRAEDAPVPLVDYVGAAGPSLEVLLPPRSKKTAEQSTKLKKKGKRRLRDEDDADVTPRPPKKSRRWWPWATAAAGLMLAVGLLIFALGSQDGTPTNPDELAELTKKKPGDGTDTTRRKATPKVETTVKRNGPIEPNFPLLYKPADALDLTRLRQELEGPPVAPSELPADAVIFRVRRLPPTDADWFASLGEACARAPADRHTVIEIHDNGPLFEPSVPPLEGRKLIVRAGKGYRPLIAWDVGASKSNRFMSIEKGSLFLDNLDLVLKWTDDRATQPATLLAMAGSDLFMQGCSVSIAGQHPRGISVARLESAAQPVQCRLSRCYLRGGDYSALRLNGSGADVSLDGCLVVGGDAPLIDVQAAEEAASTVRLIRSTLVATKTLASVRSDTNAECNPAVQFCLWDSLLARCGPPIDAELLRLGVGVHTNRMSWRVVNTLYTGWDKLLWAGNKSVAAAAIGAWRELWRYEEGDKALLHVWPSVRPADVEDAPLDGFQVLDTPVCFQATSARGPLGCDLSALPAGRPGWLSVTFDRFVIPAVELAGGDAKPPIPAAAAGLYQGERLELTKKIDLGRHLQARLEASKPGPKIVMHLFGEAEQMTSPIRVKGADLILYFEPAKAKAKPLVLVPNPNTVADREALIEVEDGSLELLGAHIAFANLPRAPLPKRMLKVRGGDLQLFDCHLEGSLGKAPPAYHGLILFEGAGKDSADQTRSCAIHQSILLSGKTLLTLEGAGARLRLQQSVFMAGGDLLRFDLGSNPPPRLNVQCQLDHNTVAVRGAVLALPATPALARVVEPIVLQADANVFLDPFLEEPRQSALLRADGPILSAGALIWQGKGNVYDEKRLQSYVVATSAPSPPNQPHRSWVQLWGSSGEQQPLLATWPVAPPSTFSVDRPLLERLRLPPDIRTPAGADLYRLRILSKKK